MRLCLRGLFAAMFIVVAGFGPAVAQASEGRYWQCAPFAREFSGIQLFGRAADWWNQAAGRYDRGATPKIGSVLSFEATHAMRAGHVATVTEVVSDRVIKVTHANWSSGGQIERNVEVVDVSPNNDWSAVKVWYGRIGKVGTSAYPTNGFIYSAAPKQQLASL